TPERKFNEKGPLDLRLGTSLKANLCTTCGFDLAECVGHFGHIDLPLPVYHVGYFKTTLRIYSSICKTCSRVLLTPKEKDKYKKELKENKLLGKYKVRKLVKEISSKCAKVVICYFCGNKNGSAIKAPKYYGILHRRNRRKKLSDNEIDLQDFKKSIEMNPELQKYIKSGTENPNPLDILNLFKRVPSYDLEYLNIDANRPEGFELNFRLDLLIRKLLVPPSCMRPTVNVDDSRSQEDDLTVKIRELVKISNTIKQNMIKGNITA
ncbi:DNA-directed RNA polymerase III subunit RPC1, partial [Bonamia ostreae]